ncbi:IS66 family insertion sequence element accessory protein TnpB [Chelatococcus sp. YT9]|uniref:IS66 family insertion sequence element accessory protein TnpB n=1 Tax=Chelatococcus sp. YT9 TaxID=2835635 RepID=UPI0024BD699C|nr:IS66 family insertion sequence element accessory protein TnpB [Chelatococcus sp. YT9]
MGRHRRLPLRQAPEDGEFRWPKVQDGVMRLTAAQLSALLEGLDWRRVHEARRTRVPVQAG